MGTAAGGLPWAWGLRSWRRSLGCPGCWGRGGGGWLGGGGGVRGSYQLSDTAWHSPNNTTKNGMVQGLLPEVKDLPAGTHSFGKKFVRQFDGMLVEPPIYLPAMLTDVRIAGGKVVVRELKGLDEVRGLREKLVFNCTGLGAKALFGDEELTPIRGQLTMLLPQPEVTYATVYENTYMFSRRDGVVLGGTHEMGDWNLQPDLTTKAAILAKQASLFEGMRDC